MSIAYVKNVTNSVFLNGSPASDGQMIDYGDVIETYDISKGLEESFLSEEIEDDGYLSIEFLAKNKNGKPDKMSIKPHCKVIFASPSSNAKVGINTVSLDLGSRIIVMYKPLARLGESGSLMAKVAKVRLPTTVNGEIAYGGMNLFAGDVIKTGGDGFLVLVYLEDKQMLKIRSGQRHKILGPPGMKGRDLLYGSKFTKINKKIKKDFVITSPTSVAGVKG